MSTYLEETLKFIESEEIRDFLRTHPDKMDWELCTQVVSRAPAPLEQKITALELIAKQTGRILELNERGNPALQAWCSRAALVERHNNVPLGAVFILKRWRHHKQVPWYRPRSDNPLVTGFDVAIQIGRASCRERV